MMILYLFMALLFLILAVLQALDASLVNLGILPWFNGIRWLRIHFITLGAVTEVLFGALPWLVARHYRLSRPSFRWDVWLTLNTGILTLLVGIPLVSAAPIYAGGTLVFIATLLLMRQLWGMRQEGKEAEETAVVPGGRRFYLMGLAYFLLGIIIGAGLWFGWADWLRIAIPLEAHVHANNWGLMSLAFAGLAVDLYARWTGHELASAKTINAIFWMMSLGALGLVLGPWFDSLLFTVPGLALHLSATIWLLWRMVKPLWGDWPAWTPGLAHFVTAYAWILVPVLIAPLIILGIGDLPGADIEANAPQALIYGWVLQVGFAVLPYFFRRIFQPEQPAALGGNWWSLVLAHVGGILLWVGIFLAPARAVLHGIAYGLWVIALIPVAWDLWRVTRAGLADWERRERTAVASD